MELGLDSRRRKHVSGDIFLVDWNINHTGEISVQTSYQDEHLQPTTPTRAVVTPVVMTPEATSSELSTGTELESPCSVDGPLRFLSL